MLARVRPQRDLETLLRGLAKFVGVVVVAGLVGAGVGIGLAKLSGNNGGDETQALPAAASASTTATVAPSTPAPAGSSAPSVEVLSALLGRRSRSTGRALVAVRVRVTNGGGRSLAVGEPVLLSERDEVALNVDASSAGSLLRILAPGARAAGTLRFTLESAIAQRIAASPAAQLRIAGRVVAVRLTPASTG